jgi:DNA-binding NarL/FixJ family response regulator
MKNAIRLAVVDDHQIVIDGIKALLGSEEKFELVECSTSPKLIVNILSKKQVDILLTDVMMPEMNGYELAKEVKSRFPGVKILALSMSGEGDVINSMINDADIQGYVLKNIGKEELAKALCKIAKGEYYFSDEVLEEMEKASNIKKNKEEARITAREVEIIRLIEKELSNKEIADALYISERTVETHRKNIFRKTKTSSVIGLIKYAYEHKLI